MVGVVWPEFREQGPTPAEHRCLGRGEALQGFEQGNEMTGVAV